MFMTWPWKAWAQRQPEACAVSLAHSQLSWNEVCQRVDALADGFYQQGVQEGTGVAIRAKNSETTLLCWLALLQCGARVLPLNPQFPESMLVHLLPGLSIAYALSPDEPLSTIGIKHLVLSEGKRWQVEWQPRRLASMTLTSGSSGLPKAAAHTFAAHLASAAGVLSFMDYGPEDCWLLSLPLFHVSGQGILWRWLTGGGQLAVRNMQPLGEALKGCTHASLVPTQLWRLIEEKTLYALREVLLGGAAIPVNLTNEAQKYGLRCWCGYGLTELASTVCAKLADGKPDVGTVLPGREVKIVNDEIWIRGNTLTSGYWRDGKLIPVVNEQGWFATRDRGEFIGTRLILCGRLDNLFFSGGEGIQPEEVERVIAGHPAVSQVFIVPQEDVEFGQRPVAVVEINADFCLDELAGWVKDKLARFQQPIRWFPLPESVKQGGIKISRKAIQEWVAGQ